MSFVERLASGSTRLVGGALRVCLDPARLGSFGFWDPWELKLAERARDIAHSENLFDVTVGRRFTAAPPLDLAANALGMRVFGVGEFGGRISDALFGVLAILGVYWAGLGLFRRRAALLGALALGSMPLSCCKRASSLRTCHWWPGWRLSMGGLGRYAWPAGGVRRWRDLLVAGVGLLLGLLSGGSLLGVALPCLAFSFAILAGWACGHGRLDDPAASKLTYPGLGAHLPAGTSLGASLRSPGRAGGVALLVRLGWGAASPAHHDQGQRGRSVFLAARWGSRAAGLPTQPSTPSSASLVSASFPGVPWPSLRWAGRSSG